VRINKFGELDHLGLKVFHLEHSQSNHVLVLDYIERELLAYILLNQNDRIIERMNHNDVELLLNGAEINNKNKITSYFTFDEEMPFMLNNDSQKFSAVWKLDNTNVLTMEFPVDYFNITGKRKDELENEIVRDLKSANHGMKANYSSNKEFNRNTDDIYKVKGTTYSDSPGISSDYFLYTCDSMTPVFDTTHYRESLNNLLLNFIPTNHQLQIKHKLYGNKEELYELDLNDFFDYFSSDSQFFFGWQTDDKEELNASIFIYNVPFAFVHLLIIDANIEELYRTDGVIKGTLYTFIRKDNLKKDITTIKL